MVLGGSSSGGRLGTAILDLRANAGPLDRGLERSEKNVRRSTGRMGKAVKVVGFAFAGAGVAAAGIGVASLKLAADFDKAFSEVRTLLPDVSDEAFGALQKDLRDFSNETGTVTTEAIPALYQAISAGVPRENVMDFLRVANKAAVGGVTDLETAVDAITSSVNSYGPEVLSATEASDLMFTAVRLGKATFDELGAALFNVVPTAASFGVGLDQVAAALAVTTAQGVPTKIATTQLRQAFVEAGKESSILAKTIKERTGKSFSQLIKEGKPVHRIFQDLREDMPEDDFRNLFSSVEAANAALLITGDAAERVDDALAEMSTSAGATDKAFTTVADTATFRMQKAMNLMRNVLLEIGIALLPALVEVLDKAVLPALTAFAGWMSDHSDEMAAGVIAVVDAAVELGSATKTAVNDSIAAYTRFVTWGENNVDRAKTFWQDTTTEALALKTAVNTDVLAAYGELFTWGTDNKAELVQLWTDVGAEALALETAVNTDVLAAYGKLFTWGTDNKAELVQLWTDVGAEATALQAAVNGQGNSVLAAYQSVLTWSTDNKSSFTSFWDDITGKVKDLIETMASVPDSIAIPEVVLPQPSLPRLPGLPFADEPMEPMVVDTRKALDDLDTGLGKVQENLNKVNDEWFRMAAIIVAVAGILIGGPFAWLGIGVGATRLLKNFLPDIRKWIDANAGAIGKEIDPLLAATQGILDFTWEGKIPELSLEPSGPEKPPFIMQWLMDNEERFRGAWLTIKETLEDIREGFSQAFWDDLFDLSGSAADAANLILDTITSVAWVLDKIGDVNRWAEAQTGGSPESFGEAFEADKAGWFGIKEFGNWLIGGANLLHPFEDIPKIPMPKFERRPNPLPLHVIEENMARSIPMPDDSALGSLATALGSIGGGRTMVFNVENLYGVDDLEDFVQEANLAALRRGQENVLT